ncbi:MAG: Gfo/Idh/MocA family oxidoreductase [Clostridia bacterium]|nr:Gfo/Idh/MocA family oxidoreductase [Clostridia bacterium]
MILIGAGNRGTTYVRHGAESCPEFELVGVADPDPVRRNYIKDKFSLPDIACFDSWEKILDQPRMADAAIIATQDKMHVEPAMKAISLGYHLLLEKPAAPTPEECMKIAKAANEKGVEAVVCHVLRFTPFFRTLKQIIDEGRLGRIINVIHLEGVGHIHQSHSYVRGNWRNEAESTPMILAKSCHDIDIIQWLLGEKCTRVQSFGSLSYFKSENRPEGAPEYCYQGCPEEKQCPYSALKIYNKEVNPSYVARATKKHDATEEDIRHTLTATNYGRCVFGCDNDVVDHQVVNLEYQSGATVSFTMSAFNEGGRRIHIMGTKGELRAAMSDEAVTLFEFETGKTTMIKVADAVLDEEITGGHGGGDRGIIRTFCSYLSGTYSGNSVTDISTSMENHYVTFAAEESRREGSVISMEDYMSRLKKTVNINI